MNMIEEFQSYGLWWLPEKPEIKVPGKFSFSPQKGIILELNQSSVSFWNLNPHLGPFAKSREPIILGELFDGRTISLYNCDGHLTSKEKGLILSEFRAEFAFFTHINDLKELKVIKAKAQYCFLEEWLVTSGIKVVDTIDEFSISYKPPKTIDLGNIKDLKISIEFRRDFSESSFLGYCLKTTLNQKAYLTIDNINNKSFESCIDILTEFRDFLSFAINQPSQILSVEVTSEETTFNILFRSPNFQPIQKKTLNELNVLFFGGSNLYSEKLGKIFDNWITKKKEPKMKYVFQLLLVNLHTENLYYEYQFINIVQALEAYHRGKYGESYLCKDSSENNKKIWKKILKVIKDFPSSNNKNSDIGISDNSRIALTERINSSREGMNSSSKRNYPLNLRLKELINNISDLLPEQSEKKLNENFLKEVVNKRDMYSHADYKENSTVATDLFNLTELITIILRANLLRDLGFEKDIIKNAIERTWQRYTGS